MSATVSYRTEFECSYIQEMELHSHRYRLEVTVDGPQRLEDFGRVIDFKTLARYVRQVTYDKCFLYSSNSSDLVRRVMEAVEACEVPVKSFVSDLSVEYFCSDIAQNLQGLLNKHEPGVRVIEVKLRETNDSFATWNV